VIEFRAKKNLTRRSSMDLCMDSLNLSEHSCSSWSYFSAFEVQKHDYGSTNEGRGYSNWGRTAVSRLLRSAATLDSTRPLRRNIHPNLTHWYIYSLKQNARRLLPRVSTSVEK
jgi:hypothetical protein